MKREIKFRAFDKIERVLCNVGIINFDKGCFLIGNSPTPDSYQDNWVISGPKEGHFVEFNRLELMQSTGMKDRNGTEIFEGDIIEGVPMMNFNDTKLRGFVFMQNSGIWKVQIPGFDDSQDIEYLYEICKSNEPLILGNIYQNSNLLSPSAITRPKTAAI